MASNILTESEFSELFNLYYEELCKVIFPILKDRDAAEDVVQDVFVKMWLRKEELTITTSQKAYLYKAVVFRALDYLRKQKSTGKVKEELKIIHHQTYQEASSAIEEKELMKAIDASMQEMPENMRAIFHLSRFSNLKNREIAEQLAISIKTVESNISKALKLLHERLKPFLKDRMIKTIFWLTLFINLIG
jgi:RNA polymerase sigma-70 factor, ECF subfamily